MWFALALLCTLVVAQSTTPLKEELLIGARYDEVYDRHRNLFAVERLDHKTFGLDGILQAQLFQSGGNTYIGTSMYNNYVTYEGMSPLLRWNSDDETFDIIGSQPDNRGGWDAQSSVYFFNTKDGNTWAYDALYTVQNNTDRSLATLWGNGSSFLYEFSDGYGSTAFTFYTNFSTSRSGYFQSEDGREFLWTFSWGSSAPAWNVRTPVVSDNRGATTPARCTVIEYTSGTWSIVDETGTDSFNFVGCPAQPRPPLSFQNVDGNWVYFFPSFSEGGGVLTLNYRGASGDPEWEPTADVLDGFGIPAADKLFNWKDDGYDMITASTAGGIRTYRLHWNTHYVEELPLVPTPQGTPYDFSWFNHQNRQCFVVGQAGYNGLMDITPITIRDYYLSIYCWDQSRDVWDLAIRFPAEFTWFNQVFQDDDQYYLVTMSRSHLTNVSVKLYKLDAIDDDYIHIRFYEGPSTALDQQSYDQGRDAKNIAIASLSLLVLITLILLIMLLMSLSKGGASGGSDYSSFG